MTDITGNGQLGMSLVEVLTSMLLLSLLVLAMLAIFNAAADWIRETRDETVAVNLAVAILEDLRLERGKLDPQYAGKNVREMDLNIVLPESDMTAEFELMQAQTAYPNLYDVMVTVIWGEGLIPCVLSVGTVIRKE